MVTPYQDMKDQRADDFLLKPVSLPTLLGCVQMRVRSLLSQLTEKTNSKLHIPHL
jgi:hypothetical protein